METHCRIVLADDHTILREGLRALLESDPKFKVIGEAENGMEAIRISLNLKPDLVLMDLSMPKIHGFEAIKEIKKQAPAIKIIALTVHKREEYILTTLQAGADGYILKDANHLELIRAIKSVLEGKRYLSPEISGTVIDGYLSGRREFESKSNWDTLTQREREVLKLVAEGNTTKEIAGYLFISAKTVEKHRTNLMRKLDLHNIAALTAFAMEKRLIKE